MKILTHYDPPPIPWRDHDWSAVDDETYDGPGCRIGWGATEQEAIDDLMAKMNACEDAQEQEQMA
jgi:hypothetical protein